MIQLISVALITCLMLALPALSRPTLPFGVRVGTERVGDPVIIAARRIYARQVVAVAAISIPVVLVIGYPYTLAADLLFYYLAHRKIRAAKQAGGWAAEQRQGVTVDTTFRTDPVRVPWLWGLPAVAILLLTIAITWARHGDLRPSFEPVLYQAGILLVVLAVVWIVLRARPDLDAAKPKGSARRYRAYLRGIAVMSLLSAACLNLSVLIMALPLGGLLSPAIWGMVPIVAMLGGWLAWDMKVGQAGHRLQALPGEEEEATGVEQRDDDRFWHLAGFVYVNRRDPALLVHARVGSASWTLNLGHPIAWLLLVALAAVGLLALFGAVDLPQKSNPFN